jgi:hypothetical protein
VKWKLNISEEVAESIYDGSVHEEDEATTQSSSSMSSASHVSSDYVSTDDESKPSTPWSPPIRNDQVVPSHVTPSVAAIVHKQTYVSKPADKVASPLTRISVVKTVNLSDDEELREATRIASIFTAAVLASAFAQYITEERKINPKWKHLVSPAEVTH